MLVDVEVEHQVNAISFFSKVFTAVLWHYVRLAKQNGLSVSPLKKSLHLPEVFEFQLFGSLSVDLRLEHKRYGVDPKALDTKLNPIAHNAGNLSAHLRIPEIQIRLKLMKAVMVVSAGFLVVRPCGFLDTGEDHSIIPFVRLLLRPDIPIAVLCGWSLPRILEPPVFVRRVVD